MIVTSSIFGTLVIVVVPGASNDAAINLRTEFFAPTTGMAPTKRWPP